MSHTKAKTLISGEINFKGKISIESNEVILLNRYHEFEVENGFKYHCEVLLAMFKPLFDQDKYVINIDFFKKNFLSVSKVMLYLKLLGKNSDDNYELIKDLSPTNDDKEFDHDLEKFESFHGQLIILFYPSETGLFFQDVSSRLGLKEAMEIDLADKRPNKNFVKINGHWFDKNVLCQISDVLKSSIKNMEAENDQFEDINFTEYRSQTIGHLQKILCLSYGDFHLDYKDSLLELMKFAYNFHIQPLVDILSGPLGINLNSIAGEKSLIKVIELAYELKIDILFERASKLYLKNRNSEMDREILLKNPDMGAKVFSMFFQS